MDETLTKILNEYWKNDETGRVQYPVAVDFVDDQIKVTFGSNYWIGYPPVGWTQIIPPGVP